MVALAGAGASVAAVGGFVVSPSVGSVVGGFLFGESGFGPVNLVRAMAVFDFVDFACDWYGGQ